MDRLDQLAKKHDLKVHWHPFLLRPDTPVEGVPMEQVYPAKFLEEGHARLKAITAEAGMPFVPTKRLVNTHRAHEAGKFAEERGQADAFHRATLRANFAEGRDVSDPEVLADIARSVGLDGDALKEALASGRYRDQVDAELGWAHQSGVSSVPTFVFPNGYAIAGAHPVEVFERVLNEPPPQS